MIKFILTLFWIRLLISAHHRAQEKHRPTVARLDLPDLERRGTTLGAGKLFSTFQHFPARVTGAKSSELFVGGAVGSPAGTIDLVGAAVPLPLIVYGDAVADSGRSLNIS